MADTRFRRVLWVVLAINAAMFVLELGAGMVAGSAALQADALDFLADAANYAISLAVLGAGLRWRAGAGMGQRCIYGSVWHLGSGHDRLAHCQRVCPPCSNNGAYRIACTYHERDLSGAADGISVGGC